MNKTPLLLDYPLFAGLSESELAVLAQRLVKRTFARNAYLYYPDTPGRNMYLVESGLVRQFYCDALGREYLLNIVGPRSSISLPLITDDPVRPTGAAAQTPATVLSLSREDFFYCLEHSPQFMRNIYADLTSSVRKLIMHTRLLASASLNARLVALLLYLSRATQGPWPGLQPQQEFTLPLSQTDLAGWLGASRGRLNRALNHLEKLGYIQVNGQQLKILDRPQLEKMAERLTIDQL